MKTALFIDRDGTILWEPKDEQIDSFEKFRFVDGVISNLAFLRSHTSHELVMVSNQDGLGTEAYPEKDFWPTHNLMLQTLKGEGVVFDDILIDRSFPKDNLPTRKPGTAMLTQYLGGEYDLRNSYVIGDRETDAQLALNLGCKALILNPSLVGKYAFSDQVIVVDSWDKVSEVIYAGHRVAAVRRTTKETDVDIRLDLDGQGQCDISTGLGFFDHMLEQIAKHGNVGLWIHVKGDLHVDEHHTIEALASRLGSVSSRHWATSAASSDTATAFPWTTVSARWPLISAEGPGSFGTPSSSVREWGICLRRCSSISSSRSATMHA